MKTIFVSMFVVLALICFFAQSSNAVVSCGNVDTQALPCISFATGKDAKPSGTCCTNLQTLAKSATTLDSKKAICRCLKAGVKNFPGVKDSILSSIPAKCNIKVGFPVSMNTDCEKIR